MRRAAVLCVWAAGETGVGGGGAGWGEKGKARQGKDVWMETDRGRERTVTAVGLLC